MNMQQTLPELWNNHDASWWIGQCVALLLALTLLWNGYGGPVAGAVGYALAVLVDIREAVSKRAQRSS
jgi:hypothetical protein